MDIAEELIQFGLSRQESNIYIALLTHGAMSGYEVAKDTNISRSNVYASLQSMLEKGLCYLEEGESTKYLPVSVDSFLDNKIEELKEKATFIKKHAPKKLLLSDGYITIMGTKNIANKIRQMLKDCNMRLYIMASGDILNEFQEELKVLVEGKKKLVVLSDDFSLPGIIFYKSQIEKKQVRLISDSNYVLTGNYSGKNYSDEHESCLYSGQQNLVDVMKEALKNKITLIERNM